MKKNKALFLDRDGTINNDEGKYYIFKPSDFQLNEGVGERVKQFQDEGYLIIIISNQGGIAKGIYSHADVTKVHDLMTEKFNYWGVKLTEIYYCPHHQGIGNCLCRKPESLMIEKAIARFNIAAENSLFIGDSSRDIEAAERVGVKAIQIRTNIFEF
jgi:D-glycero-D-manno-heptose 1,7-bisphosphate phosphatase